MMKTLLFPSGKLLFGQLLELYQCYYSIGVIYNIKMDFVCSSHSSCVLVRDKISSCAPKKKCILKYI